MYQIQYDKKQPKVRSFASIPTVNGDVSSDEVELCAQLHKDLEESMQRTKEQEHSEYVNGDHDIESVGSPDINNSQESDMELCDSDSEYPLQISTSVNEKFVFTKEQKRRTALKRRRFVGPKSQARKVREEYLQTLRDRNTVERLTVYYNPLSLFQLVLNHINKQNVPDFAPAECVKETIFESETYDPVRIEGLCLL